jgi:hypothetical protein
LRPKRTSRMPMAAVYERGVTDPAAKRDRPCGVLASLERLWS